MNFLFDVDGTLTPPREPMDDKFRTFFVEWIISQRKQGNRIIFVTGSDTEKTIQQVGADLWRFIDGSYQNCGNQLYVGGKLIRESDWKMSGFLRLDILDLIEKSPWYGTAKNNIEERVGMVNISTVGRDCSAWQRSEYHKWDNLHLERRDIINTLKSKHPKIDLTIGGEISIDIYEKGKDKSQVIDRLRDRCVFVGDQCDIGGNDHTIAMKADEYHHVKNYRETWNLIKRIN
tara:strand:- start:9353 stop:10048 length:696 start_codon:yes stop_codon:yes gene_type:complete